MIWTHPVKKAWRKWLHLWTSWLVYPEELGAILIPGSWISKENRAETGLEQDWNRTAKQDWTGLKQDWNRVETGLNRTETGLKQDWTGLKQNWSRTEKDRTETRTETGLCSACSYSWCTVLWPIKVDEKKWSNDECQRNFQLVIPCFFLV